MNQVPWCAMMLLTVLKALARIYIPYKRGDFLIYAHVCVAEYF